MEPKGSAFTSSLHFSLSWASSIQFIPPHHTSRRSILILSSHLRLCLPNGLWSCWHSIQKLWTIIYIFVNKGSVRKMCSHLLTHRWKCSTLGTVNEGQLNKLKILLAHLFLSFSWKTLTSRGQRNPNRSRGHRSGGEICNCMKLQKQFHLPFE
jgi:hypothetical protein